MSDMEINKVLAQMRTMATQLEAPITQPVEEGASNFSEILGDAVKGVSDKQMAASGMANDFQTGASDASVAEVMVAMQKASLSFQAMTEVRNKLVTAYQEIMNMPI